ncbi:hypothetical protein CKF54_04680 [Psittacicella hinzii]|uniref:Preprotein translocase subunit SecB n=1 Tax=Psittacicella hinzii TaxID=2028575 RepID=A0A3A1Y5D2_9GAMM|nr:protein-export chaperone SecB [Psittacicella hinzii]RIY32476.1 hypothetical protein CKF54_04680 [Psittacicella hinzii]
MAEQAQRTNRILSIRLVDASFEAPNKINLLNQDQNELANQRPDLRVDLSEVKVEKVNDEGVYNVSLGLTVTCDLQDKTNLFISEAKSVATVTIADEEDPSSQIFLNGSVVDVLYNDLRELTFDLITSGGFPEFQLQFLSFEQQYILNNAERLNLNLPTGEKK